ncbi:MAG: hypothetical protein COC12_14060 [Rhodobacteraceae bacterium]|nr:MAG: hypothetical protein COC12_14060 [Paracoccaceae bacterium]
MHKRQAAHFILYLTERKMRHTRTSKQSAGERIIKDIKRKTRKQYSAEEKIRIVLDGLRGKENSLQSVLNILSTDNTHNHVYLQTKIDKFKHW